MVVTGGSRRFVGRGGEKLDAALRAFSIDVAGRAGLDVGASTGGFTDCLLQRGAASVVALDVGRGQLHERLRGDGRVEVRERTDIRSFAGAGPAPEATSRSRTFSIVVADLSFISLRTVAATLVRSVGPGGDLVVLVKPQFEVGRVEASRGRGVVRDPVLHAGALLVVGSALEAAGAAMMGAMVSPLRGADGNVELFVHLRPGVTPPVAPERRLDAAAVVAGHRWAAGATPPTAGVDRSDAGGPPRAGGAS